MAREELKFPTDQQIADFHEKILARDGGLAGYRLGSSLSSVLGRVRANVEYGGGLYAEPRKLAALTAFALVIGHVFNDGNKRTAFTVGLALLKVNGVTVEPDSNQLAMLIIEAAAGRVEKQAFVGRCLELLGTA